MLVVEPLKYDVEIRHAMVHTGKANEVQEGDNIELAVVVIVAVPNVDFRLSALKDAFCPDYWLSVFGGAGNSSMW
jgi:hypothetical protein